MRNSNVPLSIIIKESDFIDLFEEFYKYKHQKMNNINDTLKKTTLTQKEKVILKLITEGKSNTEIGKELLISVHTAKAYVCTILQKLKVEDRVRAAVKAIREDLI